MRKFAHAIVCLGLLLIVSNAVGASFLSQNRGGGTLQDAPLPLAGTTSPIAHLRTTPEQEAVPGPSRKPAFAFIPNQGQIDPQVAYYSQGAGAALYFTREGVVFDFIRREGPHTAESRQRNFPLGPPEPPEPQVQRLSLRKGFVGANPNPRIEAGDPQPGRVNTFRGKDPSRWLRGLATYGSLTYRDLYPGIDLFLTGQPGGLKYEFHLKPGADPGKIEVAYAGVDRLVLNEAGDLIIGTAFGRLTDTRPVSYQEIDGRRVEVPSRFRIQGAATYRFEVEAYDPRYPLIIDPSLVFSTFLGGASSDTGRGITTDAVGSVYVVGETLSSDFPNTTGVTSYGGFFDAFVAKLDASGSTLLYSTFLGGSGSDVGWGIAVDGLGNAYVTGSTRSPDFPTTAGAVSRVLSGPSDAFVAKLDATGSVLLYGTFLGGIDFEAGYGVSVGSAGNAYITGDTRSPDFPVTAGAFDTTCGTDGNCNPRPDNNVRSSDAFVVKLEPSGNGAADLLYSTFLGGRSPDTGYGITVDASGNAYVTGAATSLDFPTTSGAFARSISGASDAFVAKLAPSGASLAYSTFLGGGRLDRGSGIAVDAFRNAYVTGSTESSDFPTTPGAFDEGCGTDGNCNPSSLGIGDDAFVAKIDPSGTRLLYSTFLGGSGSDVGSGIAVDGAGNAYVTGFTESTDFPTTPFAFDRTYKGGLFGVAFLVKLYPTGMGLRYGTFIGFGGTFGSGITVDATGDAYLTGRTDFVETTPGAFDTTFNGMDDAFVMKFRPPSSLTSIFVDPFNPRLALGQTQQFKAWGGFNDGSSHFLPYTFNPSGSLNLARTNAQAARLRDGRVLVTGGEDPPGLAVNPAELYNPAADTWSITGGMTTPRYGHTVSLLSTGKVLVSGGVASDDCASDASAELYDPGSGTWGSTGSLSVARHAATATLLSNGKVLVAGGGDRCRTAFSSAELYDPASGTWSFTGSLTTPREYHAAVLLRSGKVLVLGGNGGGPLFASLSSAEIYDPATGTWSPTGSMNVGRMTGCSNFVQPFAVLLADGRVLAAGGVTGAGLCGGAATASSEIYDPATETWTLTGSMNDVRVAHTISLLATGQVLAAGGTGSGTTPSGSTELFDPLTGTWSVMGNMITARSGHTAILLPSAEVLIVGGSGVSGHLSAVERVNPEGVVWSSSDTAVASIDSGGLASALSLGSTTITATSDGISGSTVLTVVPPNRPPTADSQSVTIPEDTFDLITLTGSDPDGDRLTFAIVAPPAHGTLGAISGPFCTAGTCTANVTYIPGLNFSGSDGFIFQVSDGSLSSGPVEVSITVTPVNDPPTATAQSVTTAEDTPVAITLTGSDADGDPLTFSLVQAPLKGQLSGTASNRTYTPNLHFNGSDSFTFRVHDGTVVSAAATVSITVTPVNDPPVANAGRDEVFQGGTTARIDGFAVDPDTFNLTYTWEQVDGPATVTLTDPFRRSSTRLFVPEVLGDYIFRFTVTDGLLSDSDEVVITVVEVLLPATLEPVEGPPGTFFTITDPHGRMEPGDLVAFFAGGSVLTHSVLATNVLISADGTSLTGTVPQLNTGFHYSVLVTPRLDEPRRFVLPTFFVPFRPGEPSINPSRGGPGTPFIIADPQGRLGFAQQVVFVEFGGSPELGTPVDNIFVTADGTELIGQVPATVTGGQEFVCVLSEPAFGFPLFSCLPFLADFSSGVAIDPVIGPPGSSFFISDPEGRLQPGDRVIFYLPGSDPMTEGAPAGNIVVGPDGRPLGATVPLGLTTNRKYFVSVRPATEEDPRFTDLFFAIVEPTEPFIGPQFGPIGTRFTITDPNGRIGAGDLAIFYRPFFQTVEQGIPAVDVSVSEDGRTLTGRVPQGLVEGSGLFIWEGHRVSVRASLSQAPRFAGLFFGVTQAPADTLPPSITAPPDITVEGNARGGASGVFLGSPVVADEIDPAPTVTNDAPLLLPLGTTTVTWIATDASGNSAFAVQQVTVVDTAPPVLVGLPPDQTLEATSTSGASLAYALPSASDTVDSTMVVDCQPGAGSTLPLGSTVVSCTATDSSGNQAAAGFSVTVVDTTPPEIIVPGDITVIATGPHTTVDIGMATASDIFPVTVTSDAPAAFEVGVTAVTWTATDANGNTVSAKQVVRVVYQFGGFLPPLQEGGVYRLGRVIPVKLLLTFSDGTPVSTATATIVAQLLVNQDPIGDPMEVTSVSAADSGNLFRYTGEHYAFNLDASRLTQGEYRLIVDLHDGSAPRIIDIGLK